MKNNLWIILISVVITLSSCITAAQFNNADDDVYYSPKASNRKQPVMIPEVDIDEIIRQNPPKYGEPTNRLEEDSYTNPMAAMYYPTYRTYQQDTTYSQNPRYSTYIDPSSATTTESLEAERLRKMYGNSNSLNTNMGWSWLGSLFTIGFGNYNNSYYGSNAGYNSYGYSGYGYNYGNNPYGYSNYGYNYGYGYNNNYYNPYSYGCPSYGYGYNNPYYYGYGYNYYSPWYGGSHYYPSHPNYDQGNGNSNSGNQPISRPRPTVGSYTPPATNTGRGSDNSNNTNPTGGYIAPTIPGRNNQPAQGNNGRASTPDYAPAAPQQSLENVNGRQVYRRPAETGQQAPQNSQANPANTNSPSSGRRRFFNESSSSHTTSPTYNAPVQTYHTPSNSGRSSGSNQGSSRSSGSSSGAQNSSGRRR